MEYINISASVKSPLEMELGSFEKNRTVKGQWEEDDDINSAIPNFDLVTGMSQSIFRSIISPKMIIMEMRDRMTSRLHFYLMSSTVCPQLTRC